MPIPLDRTFYDHPLNLVPGQHPCMRALPGIDVARYNTTSNSARLSCNFYVIGKAVEFLEKVLGRSGVRFELNGCKFFALDNDQVDFRTGLMVETGEVIAVCIVPFQKGKTIPPFTPRSRTNPRWLEPALWYS